MRKEYVLPAKQAKHLAALMHSTAQLHALYLAELAKTEAVYSFIAVSLDIEAGAILEAVDDGKLIVEVPEPKDEV